ncbi:ribosomal protein S18-alanine N-acetyltransferase [Bowmanella dokdonensis]|uniref:ribosomal protein S18-alanine N-acetyltransferase n=1 Tax=Bowmanella dokdonensis TaxID=751969 RepID=UPI0030B9BFF3
MNFQLLNGDNYLPAYELQRQCHQYPWCQETFASCLEGQYFAWQMMQGQQLLGFYVGLQVLDEGTLMDIGLAPQARGKGLSQPLLDHFLMQCRDKGISEIWLEVRVSNQGAIYLYRKNGFQVIETRKNYYPTEQGREDALIMKLADLTIKS